MDKTILKETPYAPLAELSRRLAAEGCVLLKNENNILPIREDNKVSVFGRTQIDYLKSGIGSGGLVHTEYTVNIIDGLLANEKIKVNEELLETYRAWLAEHPFDEGGGWATEPWFQEEYIPDEEVMKKARNTSDTAIIVLGRRAGEDRDNAAEKGSWYLTDKEEALLEVVSRYFENTVVLLNVGNIIDMKWVKKYNIKAVVYIWQGGQEGGNAVADMLSGITSPSGRLSDTIAYDISDYPSSNSFGNPDFNIYGEDIYVGYRYFETFVPEKVLYPFGFGLSYTDFEIEFIGGSNKDGKITLDVSVKNIGNREGREIVQVYVEAPQGKLGKAKRSLCAFAKTDVIEPGKTTNVKLEINSSDLASYDDSGITGNKSCYVLESGEYGIYVGKNVREARKVFSFYEDELTVTQRLTEALAPEREFEVLYPDADFKEAYRRVSTRTVDYQKRINDNLPKTIEYTGNKGISLIDVKNGKCTMEDFLTQLSDTALKCMVIGEGMSSPKGRPGNAGVFGGVSEELAELKIPVVSVHDGPSGIRMDNGDTATSLPNGTLLACAWDTEAAEELYEYLGVELYTHKIDSLLGPGVNIHRSPLNGRNFEYFSEDPYLAGKMGAALVRGLAVHKKSATAKHFAANSQEFHRRDVDAVVSERALREIYLKPFELCVKEGGLKTLMTSYNPINGRWSALNYELNTVILREEWGYEGMVMTDWWPKLSCDEGMEYDNLRDMVAAQNDVFMLFPEALTSSNNIIASLENNTLTRGQLQRCAANVLKFIMQTDTFKRYEENGGKTEPSLRERVDELSEEFTYERPKNEEIVEYKIDNEGKCLLCVDYISDGSEISQTVIAAKINDEINVNATVGGTNGKTKRAYMDFTAYKNEGTIQLTFQNQVRIERISIKK